MNEKKLTIKHIIIGIIVGIVITFLGLGLYEYLDDKKWEKEYNETTKYDNILTIECEKDTELDNTISCMISVKDKSKTYERLTVTVEHTPNIKYLNHIIPMPNDQYNSYDVTTRSSSIREYFYISDYEKWNKEGSLLVLKYTVPTPEVLDGDIFTIDGMRIEDIDGIEHITEDEIKIDLYKLLNVEND